MNAISLSSRVMILSVVAWLSLSDSPAQAEYPYGQFHYNPQPHWGCFGYCNGPLRPHPQYWGCFGYCPGPLNPRPRYWTCYGYCPGPLPSPYYNCFGYCPTWPVVVPVQTHYFV